MKLIFLDVDGVLNGAKWFDSEEYKRRKAKVKDDAQETRAEGRNEEYHEMILRETHIDPVALALLNGFLVGNDIKICVSSTWRIADFTLRALADAGIDRWSERFVGVTPRMIDRKNEIRQWLIDNNFNGRYAVIDDMRDVSPDPTSMVMTNWAFGLQKEDLEKAYKILHKPEPKTWSGWL